MSECECVLIFQHMQVAALPLCGRAFTPRRYDDLLQKHVSHTTLDSSTSSWVRQLEPLTTCEITGIDFRRQFPCNFVNLTFAIASRQLWGSEGLRFAHSMCLQGYLVHKKHPPRRTLQ